MHDRKVNSFVHQLQASTETIGRLGFLSAIIPVFLPFVFGISVHRVRQCNAMIHDPVNGADPRVSDLRSRFTASAVVSGLIMLGLLYWGSTLIWKW